MKFGDEGRTFLKLKDVCATTEMDDAHNWCEWVYLAEEIAVPDGSINRYSAMLKVRVCSKCKKAEFDLV